MKAKKKKYVCVRWDGGAEDKVVYLKKPFHDPNIIPV